MTTSSKYDVYGAKRTGGSGTATSSQGFVGSLGHVTDSTGLIYMRARYYDPNIGRFVSEDPSKNGTNWFVYCDNNPINMVDKDGKDAVTVALDLGTIYAGIVLSAFFRGVFIAACCSLLLPEVCLLNSENFQLGAFNATGVAAGYSMAVGGLQESQQKYGTNGIVAEVVGLVCGYAALLDLTSDTLDAVNEAS